MMGDEGRTGGRLFDSAAGARDTVVCVAWSEGRAREGRARRNRGKRPDAEVEGRGGDLRGERRGGGTRGRAGAGSSGMRRD